MLIDCFRPLADHYRRVPCPDRRPGARPPGTRELMPGTIDQLIINGPKCRHRGQRIWRSHCRLLPMNSHIGIAVLVLAGALLATPARAQTFQVDAERNGATIIRRPCDGGPAATPATSGSPRRTRSRRSTTA